MNIHEYQAKTLLQRFGVAVPRRCRRVHAGEAKKPRRPWAVPVWVVKAQIHAGGRGAGTSRTIRTAAAACGWPSPSAEVFGSMPRRCSAMCWSPIRRAPGGKEVKRIYIEEGCDIARELYLGDAARPGEPAGSRLMASTEGGMEIEEVAAKTPEKIVRVPIDPITGIMSGFHARKAGVRARARRQAGRGRREAS